MMVFRDRIQAGQQLGEALVEYAQQPELIVLGLPRGGVPVANEVAKLLDAELDVMIVRKLGHPDQEELAVGAIASGGIRVLNETIPVSVFDIEEITRHELQELHRRELAYRGNRPYPSLKNRCVIIVDDGLATGATMRAAVAAVRQSKPAKVVVAIPVAPPDTVATFQRLADEVVCLTSPRSFYGVGQFYEDFSQTTDDVVKDILKNAWTRCDSVAGKSTSSPSSRREAL